MFVNAKWACPKCLLGVTRSLFCNTMKYQSWIFKIEYFINKMVILLNYKTICKSIIVFERNVLCFVFVFIYSMRLSSMESNKNQ